MNFSEEYLYENFRKSYNEALAAKQRGNLALAKDRMYQAASFLEKLALVTHDGERSAQAARLKTIADSIVVPPRAPAAAGDNGMGGASARGYGTGTGSSAGAGSYGAGASAESADGTGMEQFFTFYSAEELSEGFESVIGLEQAKEAITEYVINPIRYPDAYSYRFIDSKAILLEGPPGTGKTTFAKAVAKEINQPFALVNVAALVNCYVGETGKNIDKVFAYLREYVEQHDCGMTVFFDELDEIAKRRGGDDKASEAAVPALLRNLDGVKSNKAFLVLANTNRKDVLDSAILSRFRKQIFIPLPDAEMRKSLFAIKLRDVEPSFMEKIDLDGASAQAEGLSGRDITFICDDFKYLLSKVKAGLSAEEDLYGEFLALIQERLNSKIEGNS